MANHAPIREYAADAEDADSMRWLAFGEETVGRLDRKLLRFQYFMGHGSATGCRFIKVTTLHPDHPSDKQEFRICFETTQEMCTRSTKRTSALVSKNMWLFEIPAPFVKALQEVLDAELRWTLTSREQPVVCFKSGNICKPMQRKVLAEWALGGGLNLYKDVWDAMGLPCGGKAADLDEAKYEEFRHALVAYTKSYEVDGRPRFKPLLYGNDTVSISMKNFRNGAPIVLEGSDKALPQTKVFRWETGEPCRHTLTVEEGVVAMTHEQGAEPFTFGSKVCFSIQHWWIDASGISSAFHLESVELFKSRGSKKRQRKL